SRYAKCNSCIQCLPTCEFLAGDNPRRSPSRAPQPLSTVHVVPRGVYFLFTPLSATLGFVPLPSAYSVFLGGVTVTYLVLVELVKRRLMRKLLGTGPTTPATKSVTSAS